MVPMMSWGKKAIAAGTLVALIIAILGFLVIAQQLFTFLAKSNDTQAENLCKDSVAVRAKTAVEIETAGKISEAKVFPVLCKTIDKKISAEPEAVKRQFADKIAKCWEMFGEGRYQNSVFDNLPFFGNDNQCFICYTMLVDEHREFKKDDKGISADEFVNYLATTDYKKPDRTYLNYIQLAGGPGSVRGLLTEEGIKPGRAYAIAYKAKSSKCQWCSELIGGGVVTSGLTVLTVIATGTITIPIAGVALASGVALGYGGGTLFNEAFFREAELDTILFTDMSDQKIGDLFSDNCNLVSDIAGR